MIHTTLVLATSCRMHIIITTRIIIVYAHITIFSIKKNKNYCSIHRNRHLYIYIIFICTDCMSHPFAVRVHVIF